MGDLTLAQLSGLVALFGTIIGAANVLLGWLVKYLTAIIGPKDMTIAEQSA